MFGTPEILATNDLTVILLFAFFLGLFTGAGRCLFICGPLFLPFAAARSGSNVTGSRMAIVFGSGRLTAYAFLGLMVSILGQEVTDRVASPAVMDISYILAGSLGIYLGLAVLLGKKGYPFLKACDILDIKRSWGRGYLHVLVLGFAVGWLPCPPLIEILAFTLAKGEVVTGTMMLTVFGIGTMLPLLPLGYVSGGLSRRSYELQRGKTVHRLAGLTMVAFGIYLILIRNFKFI